MSKLTWYNIGICLIVSWGGYAYGYGFAIFVTSLGQPTFYEYFDLDREHVSFPVLGKKLIVSAATSNYTAKQAFLRPRHGHRANLSSSILGAINALFNFGLAIGALAQGWLVDYIGRKKAFYIAATAALIGAALITSSVTIAMLIAVRLLHGFGLGMLICLVPLYLTEVAPPRQRGVLSGLTTFSFGMGYFVYV